MGYVSTAKRYLDEYYDTDDPGEQLRVLQLAVEEVETLIRRIKTEDLQKGYTMKEIRFRDIDKPAVIAISVCVGIAIGFTLLVVNGQKGYIMQKQSTSYTYADFIYALAFQLQLDTKDITIDGTPIDTLVRKDILRV